jgi:CMP-N-acetylneuraminic acid synthetase
MTPTAELRTRLRKLLNEQIPSSGSDSDTNFPDAELDTLLEEARNIYAAAAAGWTEKAGLLQNQIESYTVGQERYDLASLKDQLSYALTMSQRYMDIARGGGSVMVKFTPPEVL